MRSSAKFVFWILAVAFIGGFLLAESSGLLNRGAVTPTTAVATVNGTDILYTDWLRRSQQLTQQEQQQSGRSLTQDEITRIENQAFNEMVTEILLAQEYRRRGITISDAELRDYARFAPPDWITRDPSLQTDGQFDPAKYQRLLASSQARQGGLLVALEQYYRSEVPKEKLAEQVTAGVFATDVDLWRAYQDGNDSASVSFVVFRPQPTAADSNVSDADLRKYYDAHKADFERAGRAVVSVLAIPRTITAADSAAVRAHAEQLRTEILGGAKFEEVAKRESSDTLSGANGGDLGKGPKGRFVPEFEKAMDALKPGEISAPVLSQFGYHLIRVDEHKGDTLALRHILVRIQPSDSSATATDRRADQLSTMAASSDQPKKLDSAAAKLGLPVQQVMAVEDEPASLAGVPIPSVSAWAFGGARPGETSELFDDDRGYYLARLDSVIEGGEPKLANVREEVRGRDVVIVEHAQAVQPAERVRHR
jgi:parvulin-like peptidyl-prolyl isomerase